MGDESVDDQDIDGEKGKRPPRIRLPVGCTTMA